MKFRYQKLKDLLVILFITIAIIISHFAVYNTLFYPNTAYSTHKQVLEDDLQAIQKNRPNLEINDLTGEPMQYYIEQGENFELKTNETKVMLTTSETNVSIRSRAINSSFQLISTGNNSSNEWKNDTEYGNVNVSTILLGNEKVFRLSFVNRSVFDSGVNNSKFLVSSNPSLINFPTIISFDFRIPFLSQELLNSSHTLSLDFKFNNGKITFILSDWGGTLSGEGFEEVEEDIIYDNRSSSIYVLCNETSPFMNWRHISHNITRIITANLPPEDYPNFSNLKSLFCHMITYIPYNLTLDINDITYFTSLPPYPPINYTIGETMVFTDNGTLSYDSRMENFTLSASEEYPWKNNSQTYLDVNVTRTKSLESFCEFIEWNETKVRINVAINIPNILKNASFSNIHIILPSDWMNITFLNESNTLKFYNQTKMLNEFILGNHWQINVFGIVWGILEAWAPNYFSNVEVPTDVCRNEIILLRGYLRYPLSGDINLYLQNGSFTFHQTTLPMINSTFIFPEITITEEFPLGLLQLTLNWSNSWEFGIFEKLIYIHEQGSSSSHILFQSAQTIDIHQFESFSINLSLLQNGETYSSNSTIVFLMKGSDCLFFSHLSLNNYILNVSHVTWDPGNYSIDVIASDGSLFFAKDMLNLTIKPASIFWSFENLKSTLAQNESIAFRLYSYINPQGDDYFKILSGLTIRIWINATINSIFETNSEGFVDIYCDFTYTTNSDYLQVVIEGMLEGEVCKLQTLLFLLSNETSLSDGDRAYIHEIMRSPIKANETFYVYYQIDYSTNNSKWFVHIESFSNVVLSAYILRDNYIIGTDIENDLLVWTLEASQLNDDILVIELPGPTALVIEESISKKFRFKLEVFSEITTNNYSIDINLKFLGFPFSNLSLFDSLNRNVTDLFPITIKGEIVSLFQFNIIGGFEICYFLEGYLHELNIIIRKPFQASYSYNESIFGSWRINTPIEFSYMVSYSILGLGSWECYNTSLEVLPNSTSVITAFLPPQNWNSTISIQLIVKYFSDLLLVSPLQNFTIRDPFPPMLDYSIELLADIVRIHAYVFEPEKASGIKNVSLLNGDQDITATLLSLNHYIFDISKNTIHSPVIKVTDWAENERLAEFTHITRFFSNSPSLLKVVESQYLLPLLFSITIIGGIFISRIIKKRKTTIL
ncbi:MAG: hypothetical protein JSW11_13190 [Candidatus Heimdallarchaeota archaeon]|nr:MAG: hypothetical protein JSW11_13190 [Candidatus Heimdallarchaeota archaeon]